MKLEKIVIYLPAEDKRKLVIKMQEKGITVTAGMRNLVFQFLNDKVSLN